MSRSRINLDIETSRTRHIQVGISVQSPDVVFFQAQGKIIMPDVWRTMNWLIHKGRLPGRQGKGMAEYSSR